MSFPLSAEPILSNGTRPKHLVPAIGELNVVSNTLHLLPSFGGISPDLLERIGGASPYDSAVHERTDSRIEQRVDEHHR